jgi:hypothetical protein
MVSPTISKVQLLSYADHAKKAQNIKSPISPLRGIAPSTTATSATSASPLKAPLAMDVKSDSTLDDPPPSGPSLKTINGAGDTRANNNDLAAKALSVVAAHTSSQKSPVVNVWNIRKEQLAAARAALSKALAKEIPPESQDISASSESTSPHNTVPSITPFKSPSAPNTPHGPSAMVNGVTTTAQQEEHQQEEHDPFIVRTSLETTRTTTKHFPPPVNDTDSWPEVGKAAASTHSTTNPMPIHHLGNSVTRNGLENDQIPASMSRKSASLSTLSSSLSNLYSIIHLFLFFYAINICRFCLLIVISLILLHPQVKKLNGCLYRPKNFKILRMPSPIQNDKAGKPPSIQTAHIQDRVQASIQLTDLPLGQLNRIVEGTPHRSLLLTLEFKVAQKVYNPAHVFLEKDAYRPMTRLELADREL